MTGVFKLRSADVYEVTDCELRAGFLDDSPFVPAVEPADGRPRNEVRSLHLISHRICQAKSLDELLSTVLAALDEALGFSHSMVAMLDENRQKLFVVGSHGYGETGVGAEVALGEGLIGTVARERRLLSMSGVENELRYGRAIRAGLQRTRARQSLTPEIPLAGLPDAESYLALPLVVGDRLPGGEKAFRAHARSDFCRSRRPHPLTCGELVTSTANRDRVTRFLGPLFANDGQNDRSHVRHQH
jgi:hypothetical protein